MSNATRLWINPISIQLPLIHVKDCESRDRRKTGSSGAFPSPRPPRLHPCEVGQKATFAHLAQPIDARLNEPYANREKPYEKKRTGIVEE